MHPLHTYPDRPPKLSDTLKARHDFLNLCPVAGHDAPMQSLLDAIVNGAGRCDVPALNAELSVWKRNRNGTARRVIGNTLPAHCQKYTQHSYTDLQNTGPRYVGTPEQGGHWVEAGSYTEAIKHYQESQQKKQRAQRHITP